ncbi:MAG: aminomethyl-transferring glycine dehydrogenase [Actinomycetota bacterium]|nr:aminomethyl-transferring glycine dehydrogenase [Actinomycetota bacterium]
MARLADLERSVPFSRRHIGPSPEDQERMLALLGHASLDDLARAAVPASILLGSDLDLPEALPEIDVLAELRELGHCNRVMTTMIGLGYYGTHTPQVVLRKVLENPAWYTAYTPYQPEISQGRLEALLNYQTMVCDLTGLPLANASLLDEATAAAEAMAVARRSSKAESDRFVVDLDVFPQTLAVLQTRAEPIGIEIAVADLSQGLPAGGCFGALLQYPGASGLVRDLAPVIAEIHAAGALACVAADLLALVLLTPPGEMGADVVIGTSQRFGVPIGFGGPHAAYMSVRAGLERALPGRLVGLSIDADGNPALRLALQTREQHIRREKATSNICTAQVLLAVMASMYAVYHGREGLELIAQRIHRLTAILARGLGDGGLALVHDAYFDTIRVRVPDHADAVIAAARQLGINLLRVDADTVGISCDEVTERPQVEHLWSAFRVKADIEALDAETPDAIPPRLARSSDFLTHPVFRAHRSETQMLRYLRTLSGRDVALDRSMIPLGSCTMKLNATTEMQALSWPEFSTIHPFAPLDQADGYVTLIHDLERWLCAITGYDAVSLQPNAGSQGEFAGLLAIRGYHRSRGELQRDVCLIPSSAHGTNAASAVMAGMRVVVVACDEHGNVDLDDLHTRLSEHGEHVAALMITYPSTHGVYEGAVGEICALVHDAGGQVYVDGANLNALVGLAQPGQFGADVSHLNLHKTFCIPHGGGGPGVGPVAVRAHLRRFLPNHPLQAAAGPASGPGSVSAAPWGSASILPISWAYIRLMGPDGLRQATQVAILNANYIARRLGEHFPVLYSGQNGLVAHECILDLRPITKETGVTVEDVAKRLIDYGLHAPTMSFPVAGTLMVEPTESEDLREIERFCEAMMHIRSEIDRVAAGEWPADDNPLVNAPHTAEMLTRDWPHPYTREEACYPAESLRRMKYWSPVRRIEGAYGDRNLVVTCPPVTAYATAV